MPALRSWQTTILAVLLSASVLGSTGAAAGQNTLPDAVRRQRGNLHQLTIREYSPAIDIPTLIEGSDLVGRFLILDSHTRLTNDQRRIESDYTVQVLDTLCPRRFLATTVIVTRPGGTITIDGYQVTGRESDFPAFHPGEEYVLFLKLDSSTGRYVVPHGAQGAFQNVGGIVEQVSKEGIWNYERDGNNLRFPIESFTEQLAGIVRSQQSERCRR